MLDGGVALLSSPVSWRPTPRCPSAVLPPTRAAALVRSTDAARVMTTPFNELVEEPIGRAMLVNG